MCVVCRNLEFQSSLANTDCIVARLRYGEGRGSSSLDSNEGFTLTVPVTTIDALQHFETG